MNSLPTVTPDWWIVNGDIGISSRTIWAVMMGVADRAALISWWRYGTPKDTDDFSRCYKLLALLPHWRKRLPEVAAIFPLWGPLVRDWDELTRMFEAAGGRWSQAMEDRIRELNDEGMVQVGRILTGPGTGYKPASTIEEEAK